MQTHLTSRQLEELLRSRLPWANPATDNLTLQKPASGQRESTPQSAVSVAQAHLDTCPTCRARVRALQAVTEDRHEPALLHAAAGSREDSSCWQNRSQGQVLTHTSMAGRPTTPAGAHCPPPEVWASIAAGVESEDTENYLNHAVHCEHCGQLLQGASADLSDVLSPEEEARILALSSSTADWQTKLAAALQAAQPDPAPQGVFSRQWVAGVMAAVMADVTPVRAALAAVLFAAVVLGVQDYQLQNKLAEQTRRLEQNLASQSDLANQSDLTASRSAVELERQKPEAGAERNQIAQLNSGQGGARV